MAAWRVGGATLWWLLPGRGSLQGSRLSALPGLLLSVVCVVMSAPPHVFLHALVCCVVAALIAMHRELAHRLEQADDAQAILTVVKQHQRLHQLTHGLCDGIADILMHFLFSSFCNAIACTLQILASESDSYTAVGFTLLIVTFLPLASLSQELSDTCLYLRGAASRAALSSSSAATRRSLLMVMVAAGRPPSLYCKGLSPLNLRAAGSAIKSWYSVVSVLATRY
ncbi:Odorant receptor 27 [Frankliniella occidentalis]|nr:Odorant receptor 27 [Frankliniella occidentalis]